MIHSLFLLSLLAVLNGCVSLKRHKEEIAIWREAFNTANRNTVHWANKYQELWKEHLKCLEK
jgi:hypothetical protein